MCGEIILRKQLWAQLPLQLCVCVCEQEWLQTIPQVKMSVCSHPSTAPWFHSAAPTPQAVDEQRIKEVKGEHVCAARQGKNGELKL